VIILFIMIKEKSHKEILDIIHSNITNSGECCGYKYIQVKDGKVSKITQEDMSKINNDIMTNCNISMYLN